MQQNMQTQTQENTERIAVLERILQGLHYNVFLLSRMSITGPMEEYKPLFDMLPSPCTGSDFKYMSDRSRRAARDRQLEKEAQEAALLAAKPLVSIVEATSPLVVSDVPETDQEEEQERVDRANMLERHVQEKSRVLGSAPQMVHRVLPKLETEYPVTKWMFCGLEKTWKNFVRFEERELGWTVRLYRNDQELREFDVRGLSEEEMVASFAEEVEKDFQYLLISTTEGNDLSPKALGSPNLEQTDSRVDIQERAPLAVQRHVRKLGSEYPVTKWLFYAKKTRWHGHIKFSERERGWTVFFFKEGRELRQFDVRGLTEQEMVQALADEVEPEFSFLMKDAQSDRDDPQERVIRRGASYKRFDGIDQMDEGFLRSYEIELDPQGIICPMCRDGQRPRYSVPVPKGGIARIVVPLVHRFAHYGIALVIRAPSFQEAVELQGSFQEWSIQPCWLVSETDRKIYESEFPIDRVIGREAEFSIFVDYVGGCSRPLSKIWFRPYDPASLIGFVYKKNLCDSQCWESSESSLVVIHRKERDRCAAQSVVKGDATPGEPKKKKKKAVA